MAETRKRARVSLRKKSAEAEPTRAPSTSLAAEVIAPAEPAASRVLRIPRPDGASIVLELPDIEGVDAYFEHVRAWFEGRPEELTLFEMTEPFARSQRELAAFAADANTPSSVAPPTKAAIRLEIDSAEPSRHDLPSPIPEGDYPIVSSVSRRAISTLVLSASNPHAFTATDRGLVLAHEDVLAVGQVMLRPLGESRAATPARRLRAEQIDEIRRSVPAWNPLDEDTLEIMLSHVATNDADEDGLWTLYIDQMLDARALRQKTRSGLAKAGYRADDRSEALGSIARLDSAWVRVLRPDDPTLVEGDEDFARVVLIAEVRRRSDRLARIRYRPGTWYDPDDATTRSPRSVLEYDPYREAVEKHLARYFLQRADETDETGTLTRTVRELCSRGGITIDRNNPKRTRERLTRALDRLTTDGAIVRWTYADDPRTLPAKGYLEQWLALRARIAIRSPNVRRYRVGSPKTGLPTR